MALALAWIRLMISHRAVLALALIGLGHPTWAAVSFQQVVFRTGFEDYVCPDGAIQDTETCDDGGAVAGDGCSDQCQIEFGNYCAGAPSTCVAVCSDGFRASSEACDDGNTVGGDGCSASCAVESGFTCIGTPSVCQTICGDGLDAAGEACDDGNTVGGDGCSASCAVESGYSCSGQPSVCIPD